MIKYELIDINLIIRAFHVKVTNNSLETCSETLSLVTGVPNLGYMYLEGNILYFLKNTWDSKSDSHSVHC